MLRYDGPGTQHRFKHLMRPRQRGVLPQDVVGVESEQIVGPAVGELDVPGAVVPEVDPGFLVEFARNTSTLRIRSCVPSVEPVSEITQ